MTINQLHYPGGRLQLWGIVPVGIFDHRITRYLSIGGTEPESDTPGI